VTVSDLPTVNALLNGTAGVLLAIGWTCIRRGRVDAHRRCMLAAFTASCLFLVSYVVYHAQAGSRPFTGQGLARSVYFTILITHVLLAAAIVPLALVTLRRALGGDYVRHRRIARWTFPVWMYVSITGVVIYLMLYHWY
jgi:putative membrane protein